MKQKTSLIKKELQNQKKEIEEGLSQVADKSSQGENNYKVRFPEYGRSDDENADEVATFIDSLSMEKRLRESLEEISLALEKIEKNKYGVCEICGKKISASRLKILPTARYCLECKQKKE
jgi:RNA polymerase-binding transcription factor DksA